MYKVEFEKYDRGVDEISGKKWLADFTSITVSKRRDKKFLWWKWYEWKYIASFNFPGLLNKKTAYLNDIDVVRDLLYTDIGIKDEHRVTYRS
jgi:hypothetical protein